MSLSDDACPRCLEDNLLNEGSIQCSKCSKWLLHWGCCDISADYLVLYMHSQRAFICSRCIPQAIKVPDYKLTVDKVKKVLETQSKKVNPFCTSSKTTCSVGTHKL